MLFVTGDGYHCPAHQREDRTMTAALVTQIRQLRAQATALAAGTAPAVAAALWMAVECLDDALCRVGSEPVPGHPDQTQEHALVLGVQPGVGPDQ